MHATVGQIAELLEPPRSGHPATPWKDAAAEVGFEFPADYRAFVDVYGGGSLNDELHLRVPTLRQSSGERRTGFAGFVDQTTEGLGRSISEMRENALALDDDETYPLPILPEPGGLLIWGTTSNGDMCFWDTSPIDPDRWTVVVFLLSGKIWDRFDGGMADFLVAMLRGEYPWSRQLIAPMEDESYEPPEWKRVYGWDG
jgi:hypothetical protein